MFGIKLFPVLPFEFFVPNLHFDFLSIRFLGFKICIIVVVIVVVVFTHNINSDGWVEWEKQIQNYALLRDSGTHCAILYVFTIFGLFWKCSACPEAVVIVWSVTRYWRRQIVIKSFLPRCHLARSNLHWKRDPFNASPNTDFLSIIIHELTISLCVLSIGITAQKLNKIKIQRKKGSYLYKENRLMYLSKAWHDDKTA